MKKSLFVLATAVALLFASCKSTKDIVLMQDEMKAESLIINTCFDKSDYVVLGSIKAESDFVYYDTTTKEIVGDSLCYGTLNNPADVAIAKGFAAGYGKVKTVRGNTPLDIAKANAYYKLIEKAHEMGADTVLEPTVQIETHTVQLTGSGIVAPKDIKPTSYKVTVRAIAVQLKKNK